MSIEEYEVYIRFTFYYSIVHALFSFQAPAIIPVFHLEDNNVLSKSLLIQVIAYSIGYILLVFIPRDWIEFNAVALVMHAAAFSMSLTISVYYNQINRAFISVIWQLFHPLLLLISFLIYSNIDNSAEGRIASGSIASLVVVIISLLYELRRIDITPKIFELLKYCIPLIGHVLLGITVGGMYKLLGKSNPVAPVSIYFSVMLLFLAGSDTIYKIVQPKFYLALSQNSRVFKFPILTFAVASVIFGSTYYFIAPMVVSIIVPLAYRILVNEYILLLSLVVVVQILYRYLLGFLNFYKDSIGVLRVTAFSVIIFALYIFNNETMSGYLYALIFYYLSASIGLIITLKKHYEI